MGDVMTLVERAQEHVDESQAAKLEEKLRKAEFTLEDFLDQLQQVQKMGPIGQLVADDPGMGGVAKDAQEAVDRGELRRTEAIIRSMTPQERRDPRVLTGSRRRRIATGSGTSLTDVNRLVKQFTEMQRVMKQMAGAADAACSAACRSGGDEDGHDGRPGHDDSRPTDAGSGSQATPAPPAPSPRRARRHAGGADRPPVDTRRRPAARRPAGGSAARGPGRSPRARSSARRPTTPEALKYIPGDAAMVVEVRMDLPGDQMQKLATCSRTSRASPTSRP